MEIKAKSLKLSDISVDQEEWSSTAAPFEFQYLYRSYSAWREFSLSCHNTALAEKGQEKWRKRKKQTK